MKTARGAAVMLVYCDRVILIYFFDHVGPFQVRAAAHLGAMRTAGDQVAVSDLVRMEYRVAPVRVGDTRKLALFDSFLAQPDVLTVPLSTAVFDRATTIRAKYGFKTIDAVNLAAAAEYGCDRLLTNAVQ